MTLICIGLALLVLGILSGSSGPKLGTVLAMVPIVVWIGFVIHAHVDGGIGAQESMNIGAAFLTGILSFTAGSIMIRGIAAWRKRRSAASGND
ncbi:hypothetical protein AB3M89_05770 [Microbacterium sp. 179-I 3D2 NHS]|uniref:hypothetical protein n=1 Tax=Microbacterium sp. 179-I 3D2 NHS TaxID=3235178 RepID=UPI0039A2DA66